MDSNPPPNVEVLKREVKLLYSRDSDGVWVMDDTEAKIKVDDSYLPQNQDIGLTLSHVNYLHCLFINNTEENEVICESIHEYFNETLIEYVERLCPNLSYFLTDGEADYQVVRPVIKSIIRSMINFVQYLHSENVSFAKDQFLTTGNFGMVGDVLKFWRVRFERGTTFKSRKRDYVLIAGFITRHLLVSFGDKVEDYPDCLSYVITRMRNLKERTESKDALLLKNHIGLLSASQQVLFFQNLKNKAFTLESREKLLLNDALAEWGDHRGWISRLSSGAERPCFPNILGHLRRQYFQDENLQDIAVGSPEFIKHLQTVYTDEVVGSSVRSRNLYINRSLINFVRNISTHIAETYNGISNVDIAAAIMLTFGNDLAELQSCICSNGLLKFFMEGLSWD